ncbi:hypothetical protein BDV59DRAFT_179060 [Aspergillus ambiguus]|uniref:uncharacterized protein n=1 Tax=Aspergillus ambiguus TaxID=176160 RepID=UPI003CCD5D4E
MASNKDGEECSPTYTVQYADQYGLVSVRRSKRVSRAKVVEKTYQHYNYWLNRAVTLSFSLSTGAGVLSIAPTLRVQRLLGDDSWVSLKMRSFYATDHIFIPITDGNMDDLIHGFQNVFSGGEISPSDLVKYAASRYTLGACSLVDVGQQNYLAKCEINLFSLSLPFFLRRHVIVCLNSFSS